MLRIITRLQLYLLGHYFMTLALVRMECGLGKGKWNCPGALLGNKYGFHNQKVCAKFPPFNAFGQAAAAAAAE